MRLLYGLVLIALFAINVESKKKRKFEGDFEFADEDETKGILKNPGNERKRWIHDPENELCRPLNCKKKEMCLLDETMVAFCVNKKLIHKNGDLILPKAKVTESPVTEENSDIDLDDDEDDDVFYDSEDDEDADDVSDTATRCKPCPIVQPMFICGGDNRTYSSLCRLDYHNCIHRTAIKVSCKGFCPCKDVEFHLKRQKQTERMNNFIAKYKNTVENEMSKNDIKLSKNDFKDKKPTKMNKLTKIIKKQHQQDKYSFVPKEFKYDNQHYKYIKYKYNKPSFQEDKEVAHNEVLDPKPSRTTPLKECMNSLPDVGNRLLDWFSVVMADSNHRGMHTIIKGEYPIWCKREVRWMFAHLDIDGDNSLSLAELIRIERDGQEKCIKVWIDRCDLDRDTFISHKEWCRCFDKTQRPCSAAKRIPSGMYVPQCDSQGFFQHTQCDNGIGLCWCVDKHGVEYPNTRSRTHPNCESVIKKEKEKNNLNENESDDDNDDEEDEDENDADLEGSADQPLDF